MGPTEQALTQQRQNTETMFRGFEMGMRIAQFATQAKLSLRSQALQEQQLRLSSRRLDRDFANESWQREMDTAKMDAENRRLDLTEQLYGIRAIDTESRIAERAGKLGIAGEKLGLARESFELHETDVESRIAERTAKLKIANEKLGLELQNLGIRGEELEARKAKAAAEAE